MLNWMNKKFHLRKILVTTDFSEASKEAFPYAISMARQFGAKITLVYVVPTTLPADIAHIGIVFDVKHFVAQAKMALDELKKQEFPLGLDICTLILTGGPSYNICEAAKSIGADLIITATQGGTGLKHYFMGRTAEHIVRHGACPVLVVRNPLANPEPREQSMQTFKKVLVPVDFSDASQKGLTYASLLMKELGGKICLLYVIEPLPYPEFGYAHVAITAAKRKRAAEEKLDEVRRRSSALETLCDGWSVRSGNPIDEIVSEADERRVDMIILSRNSHFKLGHLFVGGTAEKVVRHARCPVLVV